VDRGVPSLGRTWTKAAARRHGRRCRQCLRTPLDTTRAADRIDPKNTKKIVGTIDESQCGTGSPTRARTWDPRINRPSLGSVILLFYQLLTASAQPHCSSRMQRIAGARKTPLLRFCIQVSKTSDVVLVLDQITRLLARRRSARRNCPPRIRRTFSEHDASSMPRRLLPFWLPPVAEPPGVPTTRYLRYLPSDRGRPPSVRLPQQSTSPWHPS